MDVRIAVSMPEIGFECKTSDRLDRHRTDPAGRRYG